MSSSSYIMIKMAVYETITLYELNNYITSNRILLNVASTSSSAFEMN